MKYLFGNWKMNMSLAEIKAFTRQSKVKLPSNIYVGVAVPSVYVGACEKLHKNMLLGVQNVSEYQKGAYTGEISANMLRDLDLDFCIVGHSERRGYFNETNTQVSEKIKRLQEYDILPILCVGETLEQYEKQETKQVLSSQLAGSLDKVDKFKQIIIAYEPVWAIGTGKVASEEIVAEICDYIKQEMHKIMGQNYPAIVLYGGSVSPENSLSLAKLPSVDGFLVGGASQNAEKFMSIAKNMIQGGEK